MTDLQTIASIVAIIVAVYGAGLSTYNFVLRRGDRKPRLWLWMSFGFIQSGQEFGPQTVFLKASNVGKYAVNIPHLTSLQIFLPDKKYMVPFGDWESNVSYPHELLPGRSFSIWRDVQGFAQAMTKNGYSGKVKLRVICTDDAGRVYKGKKFKFDISSWEKAK